MSVDQQEIIVFCDNNENYISLITDVIMYLPTTCLASLNDHNLMYGFFDHLQIKSNLVTNSFSLRHFNPDINTTTMEAFELLPNKQNVSISMQYYSHTSTNKDSLKNEAFLLATRAGVDSYHLLAHGNINVLSPGQAITLNAWYFKQ